MPKDKKYVGVSTTADKVQQIEYLFGSMEKFAEYYYIRPATAKHWKRTGCMPSWTRRAIQEKMVNQLNDEKNKKL